MGLKQFAIDRMREAERKKRRRGRKHIQKISMTSSVYDTIDDL